MEEYLGASTPKLGFGFMRLPKFEDGSFDLDQIKAMVDRFMDAGMTYFDTAFVYDKGGSEQMLKAALIDRYPRESFTVATKMCAWQQADDAEAAKQQFYTSLERTGAGYFDYYLLHAIKADNYHLYDEFGLWDFVKEQKERGFIKHWGFSFHASPKLLEELLTAHPDVDFVQLQINYADWDDPTVASRANYEVARAHNVPVVIMEPIKGGQLANPPAPIPEILTAANPDMSVASWAIRFAASLDGVITVLSGMSTLEQMDDNLSYMRDFKPLDEHEQAVLVSAMKALSEIDQVKCTACHYCTGGCPQQIPIPEIFAARNRELIWNRPDKAKSSYEQAVNASGASKASDCIECGQCEGACPQQLPIISLLKECAEAYE